MSYELCFKCDNDIDSNNSYFEELLMKRLDVIYNSKCKVKITSYEGDNDSILIFKIDNCNLKQTKLIDIIIYSFFNEYNRKISFEKQVLNQQFVYRINAGALFFFKNVIVFIVLLISVILPIIFSNKAKTEKVGLQKQITITKTKISTQNN